MKFSKEAVDRLFKAFAGYFESDSLQIMATDTGSWELELTNTEGTGFKYLSSFCANLDYKGMDDLFVFDGLI